MNPKSLIAMAAAFVATSAAAGALDYQPIAGASPEPIREGAGLKSKEDLEAFLDGILNAQLSEHHLAGATIAIVKDGQLFFAKGYGYADVDQKTPVDADKTLFRPGSTSKLFTWTALMQMVEQGKVDLDADVNQYVKQQLQVPSTFPDPITPRNLLTHTPGLEDGALGYLMARTPADETPMEKALALHMPARVFAPTKDFSDGRIASYSNWGAALAGLIVQNVSGEPFNDYVDRHILQPLGMTSSTFAQPLRPELVSRMSNGYTFERGAFKAHDFEVINGFEPAGSMSASATDMAKFMIAHLQNGELNGQRILKEETAKQMHARAFSPNPHINGSALGFYETFVNGYRLIGHGGDLLYFHSDLMLIPEANVGLFVSYNTAGSLPIDNRGDLVRQFMDRYFPAKLPDVKPAPDAAKQLMKYAGAYRENRHSRTKVEKFLALFSTVNVSPTPEGRLLTTNLLYPGVVQWIEVAPGVFRKTDEDTTIAFVEDGSGEVTHIVGPFAFISAYKVKWYEASGLHYLIFIVAILGFIVAIVSALRHWKADRVADPRARRARRLAALTGLVFLLFLVGLVVPIASLRDLNEIVYGLPSLFYVALALPLLGIPLALALLWFAAAAWRNGFWTRYQRFQYTVIALATAAFLWSLHVWNLLGYRLG